MLAVTNGRPIGPYSLFIMLLTMVREGGVFLDTSGDSPNVPAMEPSPVQRWCFQAGNIRSRLSRFQRY
jgi:hypothetical protein